MLSIVHRLLLSCLLAFVVLTGASPRVQADPAQARKHFEMGKRFVQVDEYRKAIEEFKAGHILEPDPAFLYNIAECYRRLGETDDALKFYRRFLAVSPPGNPQRGIAATRVTELEKTSAAAPGPAPLPAAPVVAPAPAAAPVGTPTPRPALAAVPPAATESTSAPVIHAAPATAEPVEESAPFYRRGWFYGLVGAVLVGGALSAWAISSRGETEIPGSELGNQPSFKE